MRNIPNRGLTNVLDNQVHQVSQVLAMRTRGARKLSFQEFLVVLDGQGWKTTTWECHETLWCGEEVIMKFLSRGNSARPS